MSDETPDVVRYLTREELDRRRAQAPTRPRAEVSSTGGDTIAVLRLYDVIDSWGGYWGVSAADVAAILDELPDGTQIELHLNSPGGEATEGIAIANLLRQYPAKVTAIIDGLAASAASMVAMGANELVMAPSSQLMIHDASGGCWGDALFMEQAAQMLHHLSDRYAEAYAGKAGGDPADWRALMQAETWYSPDEAVAAGLADRTLAEPTTTDPEAAVARHDLRAFAHAGRQNAPAPKLPRAAALGRPAAPGGTTREEPDAMSDTLIAGLRERLGTADDADEPTVLAALDEALTEKADPPAAAADELSPVALAEVTRLSTELAELKAKDAKREKDEFFATALRDGKTSPAERKDLEEMYDAAPAQTIALVSARAKGSVVPVATIGHEAEGEVTDDDRIYAELFGPTTKVS